MLKPYALNNYQLVSDKARRTSRKPTTYDYSYYISYYLVTTSFIEEKEPLRFDEALRSPNFKK